MACRVEVNVRAKPESLWKLLIDAKDFPRWNSTVSAIEGQIREGERVPPAGSADDEAVVVGHPGDAGRGGGLVDRYPLWTDVGQARRTFLGQTLAGSLGAFTLMLLEKERALAAMAASPDAVFAPAPAPRSRR